MNVKEHEKQDMEKAGGWHSLQHLSYIVENLEQCKEGYVTYKLYSTHYIYIYPKCDDDDGDDDDGELFLWYGWSTKGIVLFPAGINVRDPHHCEYLARYKQDLNLHRTWVQALMNKVVLITTTPWCRQTDLDHNFNCFKCSA